MTTINYIKWIAIFTGFYVILSESYTIYSILLGLVLSIIALQFTDRFLLGQPYHHLHGFRFFPFLRYLLFLLKEIYVAGFAMIFMIITHKINPAIVEIETNLTEDYQRVILANSITLTPGTITVELTDNKLRVLWINKTSDNPDEIKKQIAASIEKKLEVL
jgi:multicomponent Na+:H+ antiporter subunit E